MFEMDMWQYEYTLDVSSAHGTVTKSPNQDTYNYGDEVTLTWLPIRVGPSPVGHHP